MNNNGIHTYVLDVIAIYYSYMSLHILHMSRAGIIDMALEWHVSHICQSSRVPMTNIFFLEEFTWSNTSVWKRCKNVTENASFRKYMLNFLCLCSINKWIKNVHINFRSIICMKNVNKFSTFSFLQIHQAALPCLCHRVPEWWSFHAGS